MEEEFKSAFGLSGQPDPDLVCLTDFQAAYKTSNLVTLHEIYIKGEMPVDDEAVFSCKFFRSDLTTALIMRDAMRNRDK